MTGIAALGLAMSSTGSFRRSARMAGGHGSEGHFIGKTSGPVAGDHNDGGAGQFVSHNAAPAERRHKTIQVIDANVIG